MPLKIHWAFPVKIIGKVTFLWTILLTSEIMLENATDNPLGNATEIYNDF